MLILPFETTVQRDFRRLEIIKDVENTDYKYGILICQDFILIYPVEKRIFEDLL